MTNTVPKQLYTNYLYHLVGRFFKILPMKESNSPTLNLYLMSFRNDLIGCSGLMEEVGYDAQFMELINVIEFFLNNEYDKDTCHREVMKCITITKKLYRNQAKEEWKKQ